MPVKRKTDRIKTFEPHYPQALLDSVRTAPNQPGCYLFKDARGFIVYVGKAKNLRSRVRSYFSDSARDDERVIPLLPAIHSVEFCTTGSELDALMLEYRLIKEHKPRFNSLMVNEIDRLWLRLSIGDDYPTLSITSTQADDKSAYFPIILDEYDGAELLEAFNALWRTPLCRRAAIAGGDKACLYGQTGACAAPCEGTVDRDEYRRGIDEIVGLLHGQRAPSMDALEADMMRLAISRDYEKAARAKETLDKLERIRRRAGKSATLPEEKDAVLIIRAYRAEEAALFLFREGMAVWRENVPLQEYAPGIGRFFSALERGDANLQDDGAMGRCLMEIGAEREMLVLEAPQTENARRWAEGVLKSYAQSGRARERR